MRGMLHAVGGIPQILLRCTIFDTPTNRIRGSLAEVGKSLLNPTSIPNASCREANPIPGRLTRLPRTGSFPNWGNNRERVLPGFLNLENPCPFSHIFYSEQWQLLTVGC